TANSCARSSSATIPAPPTTSSSRRSPTPSSSSTTRCRPAPTSTCAPICRSATPRKSRCRPSSCAANTPPSPPSPTSYTSSTSCPTPTSNFALLPGPAPPSFSQKNYAVCYHILKSFFWQPAPIYKGGH